MHTSLFLFCLKMRLLLLLNLVSSWPETLHWGVNMIYASGLGLSMLQKLLLGDPVS